MPLHRSPQKKAATIFACVLIIHIIPLFSRLHGKSRVKAKERYSLKFGLFYLTRKISVFMSTKTYPPHWCKTIVG